MELAIEIAFEKDNSSLKIPKHSVTLPSPPLHLIHKEVETFEKS